MKKLIPILLAAILLAPILIAGMIAPANAITPGISLNPDEWSHTNQLIADTKEQLMHQGTVTYDYNGGYNLEAEKSNPVVYGIRITTIQSIKITHSHTEEYKGEYTITDVKPMSYGSKFTGWLDESTGTIYQPGDTAEFTGDVILIAQWEWEGVSWKS